MVNTLYTEALCISRANVTHLAVDLYVINVSQAPISGTLEILGFGGGPLSNVAYNAVQSGGGTGTSVNHFPAGGAPVYLVHGKVTVEGPAQAVRANLLVRDSNGNAVISLSAT